MRPFHLAILECDSPLSRTHVKYGGYGDVFTALLRSGAEALGQSDFILSDSNSTSSINSNGFSSSSIDPNTEKGRNGDGREGKGQRRKLRITKWNAEKNMQQYPSLEDIDGILVTGSSE